MKALNSFLTKLGRGVGNVVGTLYQSGREAIDQVIVNILPFMAFIAWLSASFSRPALVTGSPMRWPRWPAISGD